MNFSQGHSGTKVQCESWLVFLRKTQEFTLKKGRDSYELFVLALSLVWFAGATPDQYGIYVGCVARSNAPLNGVSERTPCAKT